jgi:hypothetical protein
MTTILPTESSRAANSTYHKVSFLWLSVALIFVLSSVLADNFRFQKPANINLRNLYKAFKI